MPDRSVVQLFKFVAALLLLVSAAAQAKKQVLYTFYGDHNGNYFGESVSAAGDVNNDGYLDFIVGAASVVDDFGSATVYSGLDGSVILELNGTIVDDKFGTCVSGAGDINNDGYADVLVASPEDDTNYINEGAVRAISGIDGSVIYTFYGGSKSAKLCDIDSIGDTNLDGYDDFLIGNFADSSSRGSVGLVDGKTGVIFKKYGVNTSDRFGYSLSSINDINGDGYKDIISSAPNNDDSGDNSGFIKVLSGSNGEDIAIIYGNTGEHLSYNINDAGDVDNDGYSDIIARNHLDKSVGIYSGANGHIIRTAMQGPNNSQYFGYGLDGVGDINLDGYDDYVIGDHQENNNYTGSGSIEVYSGKDGKVLYRLFGPSASVWYAELGKSISHLGDINKDGYPDLIVGARGANNPGGNNHTGAAMVISGKYEPSIVDGFTNSSIAGLIWKGEYNGVEGINRIWMADWSSAVPGWVKPSRKFLPDWDASLEYDIKGTGDFDGDGDADLLWRHRSDGQWRVWCIQNGYRTCNKALLDFDSAHEWTVSGSGDTDKDGDDDVILNNGSTGEISIRRMEFGSVMNEVSVGTKAGYGVVRIGDFDGDHDIDLLLQEQGGNTLRFWELENNALVQEHTTPQTGSGFTTQCAGDFNGDGNDDVYLLAGDGTSKWFHYVDFVRQAQIFGANQSAWTFYGCGDYDGDGDSDILWTSADGLGINKLFINQNFNNSATYYFNRYGGTNAANLGYGFEYRGNNN